MNQNQCRNFAPMATTGNQLSFQEGCARASMAYTDMLLGVDGEYVVEVIYGGKVAGCIIISPVEVKTEESFFYGLKIVGSDFYGLRANDFWYLPVSYLRHRQLRQVKQSDAMFAWQAELHAALRSLIPQAIAHHFGWVVAEENPKQPTQVAAAAPVMAATNVVSITTGKQPEVAKPVETKNVENYLPFSLAMLDTDGMYQHASGVIVQSSQKHGLSRVLKIKSVPLAYTQLKGMANTSCFVHDIGERNEHKIRNFKFVSWLRAQLAEVRVDIAA